jgi:hypothetical protein
MPACRFHLCIFLLLRISVSNLSPGVLNFAFVIKTSQSICSAIASAKRTRLFKDPVIAHVDTRAQPSAPSIPLIGEILLMQAIQG